MEAVSFEHNSISKHNPSDGSSYIILPKGLARPWKGFINIQNINDNECFKLSIARYLNPENNNRARVKKADKDFNKKLDLKDIKLPVKIRDIHNIEKKISLALAFLATKIQKNIQSMYQKNVAKKTCWLFINTRRRKNTL